MNSPVVPRSEKNSGGLTTQLRPLRPRGAAKTKQENRRRGKLDSRVRFPSSDEESEESFPDDETAYDDGHSIFGTRDSFSTRKIFPASEEVFASTAELCSINFFFIISLVMEAMGIVTFFCFMHLLTLLYVSLILTCLY